jgi:streptogramin lyase
MQTLHTYYLGAGAAPTNVNFASGASFWSLDRPSENAVFRLSNSQVSAYPVGVYVVD